MHDDTPTPGEVAYAAYWRVRQMPECRAWAELPHYQRFAWEAAAQAVLAQEEKTKMQWSHMTNAQALALKDLLRDLGVPVERQFWRQSQTHDNDHTCYVAYPTGREIEAIAQLMKTHRAEDTYA